MSLPTSFKLSNGQTIPAVGLGTWQSNPNEVKNAVEVALKCGYRHIDAAACYDNEREVGDGIKASGVDRRDIFLTSKLWNTHHKAEDVERQLDISLADLQTDYVDLYLIHFPVAFRRHDDKERFPINESTYLLDIIDVPLTETWTAMEAMVKKGKVKSIGLSNFNKKNIEIIWEAAEIKPVANQVEIHPYFQQQELLDYCNQKNILLEAYSPLGNSIYPLPMALHDPTIIELAKDLGKTPVQVILSWVVQRGVVVLTKSVTPSRIEENFKVFTLPEEVMGKIKALERNTRYNFPARYGVDFFGDADPAYMEKAVEEFRAKQKALRGVA